MKKSVSPHAMIFDLDGTLINSAPDIAGALNMTLNDMGHASLDVAFIEQFIGNGPQALVQGIFDSVNIPYDDDVVDTTVSGYLRHYHHTPVKDTHFFPHVFEDLHTLKQHGYDLGICTNKPHDLTAVVLEKLQIQDIFTAFCGADTVSYCKPHANHLQQVMYHMGTDNHNTFYVGDTEVDRTCAHSAKTPFFIVPWGGGLHMQQHNDTKINRLSDLLQYCQ